MLRITRVRVCRREVQRYVTSNDTRTRNASHYSCSRLSPRTLAQTKKCQTHASMYLTLYYLCLSSCLVTRDYSMIEATLPEPTVRPPSRIANVRPCSIAIGWMSSIVISTLSPGMHISVPSGRLQTPVTSVVLK